MWYEAQQQMQVNSFWGPQYGTSFDWGRLGLALDFQLSRGALPAPRPIDFNMENEAVLG